LLAFNDGKDLRSCLLPTLFLSYPCPLQEVFLAISFTLLLKVIIALLTDLQMDLQLSQGYLKGVFYLLDACHLL
jgi:hypothetical protein